MSKKNPNNVALTLSDVELENLKAIMSIEGQTALPGVIHSAIAGYYNKLFPGNVRDRIARTVEEEKTPEERCVAKGGTVGTGKDGVTPMCILPIEGSKGQKRTLPMSMV